MKASQFLMEQLSDESLWMRYQPHLGFDYLYAKGEQISFTPPSVVKNPCPMTIKTKPEASSVVKAETSKKDKVKKNVTFSDIVSFPYIKEEQIEEMKSSANSLIVKERDTPLASKSYSMLATPLKVKSLTMREGDMTDPHKHLESHHLDRREKTPEELLEREESDSDANQSAELIDLVEEVMQDLFSSNLEKEKKKQFNEEKSMSIKSSSDSNPNAVTSQFSQSNGMKEKMLFILCEWFTVKSVELIQGDHAQLFPQVIVHSLLKIKARITHSAQFREKDLKNERLQKTIQKIVERLDQEEMIDDLLDNWIVFDQDAADKKIEEIIEEIDSQHPAATEKKTTKDFKQRRRKENKVTSKREANQETNPQETSKIPFVNSIPLTSNNALSLRRNTLLQEFDRCVKAHLPLDMTHELIKTRSMERLKQLVNSFDLTPKNIILSDEECRVMLMYLFQLLHFQLLKQEKYEQYIKKFHPEIITEDTDFSRAKETICESTRMLQAELLSFKNDENWQQVLDIFI
jgi:hypothetical protein